MPQNGREGEKGVRGLPRLPGIGGGKAGVQGRQGQRGPSEERGGVCYVVRCAASQHWRIARTHTVSGLLANGNASSVKG